MSEPQVAVVMGSDSDWPVMSEAVKACAEFGIACHKDVVSAHRMPEEMLEFGRTAAQRGFKVIIAGAGAKLDGLDSLLSIVQMPAGVPVATVAIGNARNAGLLAVRILAAGDPALQQRMRDFQSALRDTAAAKGEIVRSAELG